MSVQLRDYQIETINQINQVWNRGVKNVLSVLPTGAGKTVVFSDIIRQKNVPTCAIAHRKELVGQISLALARNDLRHNIIAPPDVVKEIVNLHMFELGRQFYSANSNISVAGVDTLIRRIDSLNNWRYKVGLWVMDEAHHVQRKNKWGKAIQMFPNALGLGVTACTERGDGYGLGRQYDGYFDDLIQVTNERELIDRGYLCDYRIFCPPSDLILDDIPINSNGEFAKGKLTIATNKSHIVGDVVAHYLRIASDKLGIVFANDIENAERITKEFIDKGVNAAIITGDTPSLIRAKLLKDFRERRLTILVNVDLFGEGFDLPSLEVVIMARATASLNLYRQQFGRVLRILEGKSYGIVIDHVGNIKRHGLPDKQRIWTLSRREKRTNSTPDDAIPLRNCASCTGAYSRLLKVCPYCGYIPTPAARSGPQYVDGDLIELDAATLEQMRNDVDKANLTNEEYAIQLQRKGAQPMWIAANVKRHEEKQAIQTGLKQSVALWAGYHKAKGRDDSEIMKRFYWLFGIDMLTFQTLNKSDSLKLADKVNEYILTMEFNL